MRRFDIPYDSYIKLRRVEMMVKKYQASYVRKKLKMGALEEMDLQHMPERNKKQY